MSHLTSEQVLALAPDAASAKSGRDLASAAKWQTLGTDAIAMWGECKGSGAAPYQARVELATIGFKCSCPSRKFPCKHVLALLLIGAAGNVPNAPQPNWVTAWLNARAEKAAAKPATAIAAKPIDEAASSAAASKRSAAREDRVALGLDEMDRWLTDVLRLGLARVRSEGPKFWDAKAARLVDAQAPGLARRVRALAGIAASGSGWEERMLDAFGALHLLRESFARIGELSPERAADVRRQIGWTQREADVLARTDAIVEDRWSVIGTRSEEDDRVIAHRAWLRGERTGRSALILQFTQGGIPLSHHFIPGTVFDAKLAYFEASVPQRAAVANRDDGVAMAETPNGHSIPQALETYAAYVASDPWFETMAICVGVAQISQLGGRWYLCDDALDALPLAPSADGIALAAICGARPTVVAGEWNGRTFLPLGAWTGDRYAGLT